MNEHYDALVVPDHDLANRRFPSQHLDAVGDDDNALTVSDLDFADRHPMTARDAQAHEARFHQRRGRRRDCLADRQ